MSFTEILEAARDLPLDLKLELLDKLNESINFPLDPEVEASWNEEIDKRIMEIDTGKVKPISYEDLMTKIKAKVKKWK
jgi:putative addiction module component (TIGR02574 family)